MGMFSFFYGLPPGYFATFEAGQRSPVLLDQFQQQDYQLGLFSSASLSRPVALDRTAFANVPDLRISSEPESDMAWKRDRTMTDDWFDWLAQRDPQRPFFGFLFYDATSVHAPPPGYQPPSLEQGARSIANEVKAYQAAMHYNDSLIGGFGVVLGTDLNQAWTFDVTGTGVFAAKNGFMQMAGDAGATLRWFETDEAVDVGGNDAPTIFAFSLNGIPTPGAAALFGLAGLAGVRRRR